MRTDATYTPTAIFAPFPRPTVTARLRELGEDLHQFRKILLLSRQVGLTTLYSQLAESTGDADLSKLRNIHREIDIATLTAYGWEDIDPEHQLREEGSRRRYTISEAAATEVVNRLLEENHRRAAIEAQQNTKKSKRGKSLEESDTPEGAMF